MRQRSNSETHQEPGKTKDGEDVSGSINVPEVAHDTEPDDYVVSPQRIDLDGESSCLTTATV